MQDEKTFEYWKELYLLHSKLDSFKRKVDKSFEIIQEFLLKDLNNVVSCSAGKDSTVLMHLVTRLKPDIKVISEKDDLDFPNELEYLYILQEKYNLNLDILIPNANLWDILKNYDFTEDIHSKGTSFSDTYFYDLIKKYNKENKITGAFLGLRAEESKRRQWNMKHNHYIYYNNDWKQWICQPLATWKVQDIFAYLFSNDIPILDIYFKTKYKGSPENIRKSWILPSGQSNRGEVQWLKHYYPQLYNKLCIINPKVRCYV